MARETGPINKRLSSLQGQGGDYETEIRYMGVARAILGGLKERLRLGNINVGAIRQVLPDGTEIIARTVLGAGGMADVDSVFINQPVPVSPQVEPGEVVIETLGERRLLGLYKGSPNFNPDVGAAKIFSLLTNGTPETEFSIGTGVPVITFTDVAAGPNSFCIPSRIAGYPARFYDRAWQLQTTVTYPFGQQGIVNIDDDYYFASPTDGSAQEFNVYRVDEVGNILGQFGGLVGGPNGLRYFTRDDAGTIWTVEDVNFAGQIYFARQYDTQGQKLFEAQLRTDRTTGLTGSLAISPDSFYVSGATVNTALITRYALPSGEPQEEYNLGNWQLLPTLVAGPMVWFDDRLFVSDNFWSMPGSFSHPVIYPGQIRRFSADLKLENIYTVALEPNDVWAAVVNLRIDEYYSLVTSTKV
jgi:hypothetical protein